MGVGVGVDGGKRGPAKGNVGEPDVGFGAEVEAGLAGLATGEAGAPGCELMGVRTGRGVAEATGRGPPGTKGVITGSGVGIGVELIKGLESPESIRILGTFSQRR
jgi:hypothetical protein